MEKEYLEKIGLGEEAIAQVLAKAQEEEKGLIANRDEIRTKLEEKKKELEGYTGIDIESHWANKKKIDSIDEKNLMDKGEFDKVLQKKEEEWVEKNRDIETKYNTLKSQYVQEKENRAILGAVGDQGNGELIMAAIRYAGLVSTLDTDKGPVLRVKGIDGKDVADIDALIKQMKESDKFACLFNSAIKSGGGAKGSDGVKGGLNTDGMTPAQKMDAGRKQA